MTPEEMLVSIKALLDAKIDANRAESEAHFAALEQSTKVAFVTAQIAIDKADTATEKRFQNANEFRGQLTDQATRFATRELLDVSVEKATAQIARLRDDTERFATREFVDASFERFTAQAARQREDLDALVKRLDLRQGREDGARISTAGIVTMVTVAIALIGLAVLLARSFSGR